MTNDHPRWNWFDTAYGATGLLLGAFIWGAATDGGVAVSVIMLLVLAYAAGRTAGSHR